MSYKFAEKTNNKQRQITYILFMIIGSYFHKSTCASKAMESSLFLHYKELSANRQEMLEERVIRDSERVLEKILPLLAEENCEISIRHKADTFLLMFETGFETVLAKVDKKGNYQIRFQSLVAA